MDPRTSALLVVDLQNDTVGEQGAFADDGAAWFAARHGVIEKAKRLVAAARTAGMPVVFVWHIDEPGHRDSTRNAKLFRDIVAANALVRGTWGADHGYEVVLAADATATISDDWQQAALSYALTRIAELRSVDEVIAELGA
jgi:nicotinamidase-related amidase